MTTSLNGILNTLGYILRLLAYWLGRLDLTDEYAKIRRELIKDLREVSSKIFNLTVRMPNRLYLVIMESLVKSLSSINDVLSTGNLDEEKFSIISKEVKRIKSYVFQLHLHVLKDNIIGSIILFIVPLLYLATIIYSYSGINIAMLPLMVLLLSSMMSINDIKMYTIYLGLSGIYSLCINAVTYILTTNMLTLLLSIAGFMLVLLSIVIYSSWRLLEVKVIEFSKDKLNKILLTIKSILSKEEYVTVIKEEVMKRKEVEETYKYLVEKYREVYGEQGEEILKFRIKTLIEQGMSYSEAVRKIKEEL